MREKIEWMIKASQETIDLMEEVLRGYCSNPNYAIGVIEANKETIRKLKWVLDDGENDHSRISSPTESGQAE